MPNKVHSSQRRKNYNLLIGITGGIGSGKSLFSEFLKQKGEIVLDSDAIAKDLMFENQNVRSHIAQTFGSKAYLNSGKLNSKFIAEEIYSDPIKYKKINSIVHPPTIIEIQNIAKKEFKKRNLVFVESALIFETNIQDKFDYIVLLKSEISNRLKRIVSRDSIEPEEFFQRAQYQIDPYDAEELADFVIHNDSTIEELNNKFTFIWNLLTLLSKEKKNNST
ncbi:MAG: dephospho-CoA kinase [Bacteroidetes bacterium]|nr:dephospho-CoA kinase [Bacteroidota bacterium]